jgi:hypothetical protein
MQTADGSCQNVPPRARTRDPSADGSDGKTRGARATLRARDIGGRTGNRQRLASAVPGALRQSAYRLPQHHSATTHPNGRSLQTQLACIESEDYLVSTCIWRSEFGTIVTVGRSAPRLPIFARPRRAPVPFGGRCWPDRIRRRRAVLARLCWYLAEQSLVGG